LAESRFPALGGWKKTPSEIWDILNAITRQIFQLFRVDGKPATPEGKYGKGKGFGNGTVHHAAGSLRMPWRPRYGQEFAQDSVVDRDLKVIGTERLYVCDMSVVPIRTAANPVRGLVALACVCRVIWRPSKTPDKALHPDPAHGVSFLGVRSHLMGAEPMSCIVRRLEGLDAIPTGQTAITAQFVILRSPWRGRRTKEDSRRHICIPPRRSLSLTAAFQGEQSSELVRRATCLYSVAILVAYLNSCEYRASSPSISRKNETWSFQYLSV
jgi:hypothetical protein